MINVKHCRVLKAVQWILPDKLSRQCTASVIDLNLAVVWSTRFQLTYIFRVYLILGIKTVLSDFFKAVNYLRSFPYLTWKPRHRLTRKTAVKWVLIIYRFGSHFAEVQKIHQHIIYTAFGRNCGRKYKVNSFAYVVEEII